MPGPDRRRDLTRQVTAGQDEHWSDPAAVAAVIAPMLNDVTLLISVPTFDDPYLKAFLAASRPVADVASPGPRHLLDGPRLPRRLPGARRARPSRRRARRCGGSTPGQKSYARALGLNPDDFDAHTALGDCPPGESHARRHHRAAAVSTTSDRNDPRLTHGADTGPPADGRGVPRASAMKSAPRGSSGPSRRSYRHQDPECGAVTTMGVALAETYAAAPASMARPSAAAASMHRPVGAHGEFTWMAADGSDTTDLVGT